jgi:hypothetical protein
MTVSCSSPRRGRRASLYRAENVWTRRLVNPSTLPKRNVNRLDEVLLACYGICVLGLENPGRKDLLWC